MIINVKYPTDPPHELHRWAKILCVELWMFKVKPGVTDCHWSGSPTEGPLALVGLPLQWQSITAGELYTQNSAREPMDQDLSRWQRKDKIKRKGNSWPWLSCTEPAHWAHGGQRPLYIEWNSSNTTCSDVQLSGSIAFHTDPFLQLPAHCRIAPADPTGPANSCSCIINILKPKTWT